MATYLNKESVILCTALHGTHDCSWSVRGICLGCIADMFEDDEFSVVNQHYLSNSLLYMVVYIHWGLCWKHSRHI